MLFLSSLRSSVTPFGYCVLIASVFSLMQVTGPDHLAVASASFALGEMKPESPQDEPRTFRQARKALAGVAAKYRCAGHEMREIGVSRSAIELSGVVTLGSGWGGHDEDGSFSIRFEDVKKTIASGEWGACGKTKGYDAYIETKSHKPARYVILLFSARQGMDQFVDNLHWLVLNAPELPTLEGAQHKDFNRKAAEWRAATVKPPLPENVRQHKVLAENAIQEKDFAKAIDEYDAGLDAFPTWPEGQFNTALLCGEVGDYDEAIEHMHNYLELVPDAADAQAARDKIVVWRDKLGHAE